MQRAQFSNVALEDVYADLAEKRGDATRPYIVVNMVSSVDGKAAFSGRAGHLGSQADRLLMRHVRAGCDALVYGVGTLRSENVDPLVPEDLALRRRQRGQADQPLRVVVSGSGNVPLHNLFFRSPGEMPVVFTSSRTDRVALEQARERCRVIILGEDLNLRQMARVLVQRFAVRSMVVEGGPALTYSMIVGHLVDDLFLTVAAKIVGGQNALSIVEGPELAPEDLIALSLVSVHRFDDELFLRYRVMRK